jgi:hypothetical protein
MKYIYIYVWVMKKNLDIGVKFRLQYKFTPCLAKISATEDPGCLPFTPFNIHSHSLSPSLITAFNALP